MRRLVAIVSMGLFVRTAVALNPRNVSTNASEGKWGAQNKSGSSLKRGRNVGQLAYVYSGILYGREMFIVSFQLSKGSSKICDSDTELFTDCGSSCPDTCENNRDTQRVCTLQCVSGCFCKSGLVRRKDDKCVTPSECKE